MAHYAPKAIEVHNVPFVAQNGPSKMCRFWHMNIPVYSYGIVLSLLPRLCQASEESFLIFCIS